MSHTPDHLPYTGDPEADSLIAQDPVALLIGFVLDQQVTVQKAFAGPLELRRRVGTLEPAAIASMDPERLDAAFRERPALHRFPGNMARRTRELCEALTRDYDGDARRIWTEARDAADLRDRLRSLPGIGDMKADTLLAVLGKRFGIQPTGWAELVPQRQTLGDVDSPEALAQYQSQKRAAKAEQRTREGG
jgi:uncharacterized HhH-GPD family protein